MIEGYGQKLAILSGKNKITPGSCTQMELQTQPNPPYIMNFDISDRLWPNTSQSVAAESVALQPLLEILF